MRYCNQCHRISLGEALYCNFCGSSYNVKLCPSRHINPRTADVCSQCGSRDLSTPAPRASWLLLPVLALLSVLPATLMLLLSLLVLVAVVNVILTNQQIQGQLLLAILILALLWWAYLHLPRFLRSLLQSLWRSTKPRSRGPGH